MFNRINKAAPSAIQNVSKAVGGELDKDLALYRSLNENDFAKLSQMYGQENVIEYIETMERKRIKGGK